MARIILSVAFSFALASAQRDSSNARILQEQRYIAAGWRFGSAFAQDDGLVFREESTGNNNRIGEYSYIGDDGQTYTVRYSAGVDGFRILSGDHIPSGGQNSAQRQSPVEEEEYDYQYYDDSPQQSVFVNPHDPSHRQVKICLT